MTEILIAAMNLPAVVQRAVAAMIAVLAGALCVAGIWTAVFILNGKSDFIIESRKSLGEIERIIGVNEAILRQPLPSPSASEFLDGDSDATNQATLQARLNSLAAANGAIILSVGGVPSAEIEGIKYVGIRASLQGGMKSISDTLRTLETGKPFLVVKGLEIRGGNSSLLTGPIQLNMQLTFFGAKQPTAQHTEQKVK